MERRAGSLGLIFLSAFFPAFIGEVSAVDPSVTKQEPIKEDPRKILDSSNDFPFANEISNATGIVAKDPVDSTPNKNNRWGSGTMINECLMITNNHVARSKLSEKVYISLGKIRGQNRFKEENIEGKIVAYRKSDSDFNGGTGDWAVLKLNKKVAAYIVPARIDFQTSKNREIYNVGVPGDLSFASNSYVVTGHSSCRTLEDLGVDGWAYNCASTSGMSGGGIFVTHNGRPRLIGMNVQGSITGQGHLTNDPKASNAMVPLKPFYSELEEAVKNNPCN